jgi:HEAT repeat protein/predicted MFS family arabinose efflux permease
MAVIEHQEPTNVEKLRGLPWSITGDTTNTIFAQLVFFGSVFILFLDKLGLNKTQIGSLLSLIPFCGLLALFIAPAVARFGYKRTFVTYFGIRKVISAFLLLTPWVVMRWGPNAALLFVAAITGGFALTKAVADTAAFPWVQEYIPDSVRGKYYATSNLFTTLAAFASVTTAGFVISRMDGLTGFMLLIGVGVLAGFVSVFSYSRVPGGAPDQAARADLKKLLAVLRDRNFLGYMLGINLIVIGFVPLLSFLPLFMREQVGLSDSSVVLLQTGNLVGGLMAGYLWGWTSDRYGSKPVMMSGLTIRLLLPLLWFLMPRHTDWSLAAALSIAVLQGIGDVGWAIGSARLLFVSVVPADKNMEYMALYYAWIGLISGLSQLLGGFVLDLTKGIHSHLWLFTIDPYTILMASALILTALSIWLLRGVRPDSPVSVSQFAGLFLRGNPFMAIGSVIRYYMARDEHTMVFMTERLGQAHSLLAVDELLDALNDPRFAVRFEAIITIGRMPADPRLTEALIKVMRGKSPALSVIAAWALGRTGDRRAVEPLREGLHSTYRSIQSHCARSLATLGDRDMIPLLLDRLPDEPDYGLQVTYASALGKLGASEATDALLPLLAECDDETVRMELALAVARTVGPEDYFIRLLRQVRGEPGTALAQALGVIRRKVVKAPETQAGLLNALDTTIDALARHELATAAQRLQHLLQVLPKQTYPPSAVAVLQDCATQLGIWGERRMEYLLLVVQTLHSV